MKNKSSKQPSANSEILLPRLHELFFFRQWAPNDLQELARHVRLIDKKKNEILFWQNDACRWLFILLQGQIQMFVQSEDGRDTTLHVLQPGALVACAALFLGKAYPASARVLSADARLLAIEGEAFLKLLAQRPDLSQKMIGALAARLSDLAGRLESHASASAEQRLAQWLLEQPSRADEAGGRVLRITGSKKAAAANLGMTPETFSRSLRKLIDAGILEVEDKVLRVIDGAALEEAALKT